MTDDELEPHVIACERIITLYADNGLHLTKITARHRPSRELSEADKFRLCVLLCKRPGISVVIGRTGKPSYYPRHAAPAGAFNISEIRDRLKTRREQGAILLRAGDLT